MHGLRTSLLNTLEDVIIELLTICAFVLGPGLDEPETGLFIFQHIEGGLSLVQGRPEL